MSGLPCQPWANYPAYAASYGSYGNLCVIDTTSDPAPWCIINSNGIKEACMIPCTRKHDCIITLNLNNTLKSNFKLASIQMEHVGQRVSLLATLLPIHIFHTRQTKQLEVMALLAFNGAIILALVTTPLMPTSQAIVVEQSVTHNPGVGLRRIPAVQTTSIVTQVKLRVVHIHLVS